LLKSFFLFICFWYPFSILWLFFYEMISNQPAHYSTHHPAY